MSRLTGRVTLPEPASSSTNYSRTETHQYARRNGNPLQNRPNYNNYRNQNRDHEEGCSRQNRSYCMQDRYEVERQNRPQNQYRNQDRERENFRQSRSYRNQDSSQEELNSRQHRSQYRNQDEVKPRGKGNVRYQGTYSDRFQQQENRQPYQQDKFQRRGSQEERQYLGPAKHQERDERPKNYQKNHQNSERSPTEQIDRKSTVRVEDVTPTEELLEVEDIIEQISDLKARSDRSAAQIKRNIMASNDLMEIMDDVDWEKVCLSMISTGLEQREPEFIADLMVALFKYERFTKIMSEELIYSSSKHVIEGDDKPYPEFLSAILCANWPRQQAKAFCNVNPILYTAVCIIKGWIDVVKEDTENFHKKGKKSKYQRREEESEEPKEKVQEEPELINKCAVALSDLCDAAQRRLWTNWMELTDEIYQCLKPAITHNMNIEGDVKERLLNTFIQMNGWTKARQVGVKHNGCQTVSTESD